MEKNTKVSSWEKIQRGVKETERLMGQKQYNLSMMKARQTLEYMVRRLCDQAGISDGDLSTMIDELALNKWISKTTCEHYHTIRVLGNKAIHEGHENAYDCNQSFHLLSQEVYVFANNHNDRKRSGQSSAKQGSRSRKQQKRMPVLPAVFILCLVIIIVFVVKLFSPSKTQEEETTGSKITTEQDHVTVPTVPQPETMAPTTPVPVYKVSPSLANGLNVRANPSTDANKLGVLEANTIVEVVREHDSEWTVIKYNGQEAYVAAQYLEYD